MGLVQSVKTAGSITVEVTSPGLTSASVTIEAKATTLRPQVAAWEREVPSGAGITGLWRLLRGGGGASPVPFVAAESSALFTLHQDGTKLTGTMESAAGGGFFGSGEGGTQINDGKADGDKVSFKVGSTSYAGTVKGDQIELQRTLDQSAQTLHPAEPSGPRQAIGPPPDGSDPSRGPQMRPPASMKVILRRVTR
jgi:beta-galactosidase